MKKSLLTIALLLNQAAAFASSSVVLPINNQTIEHYPGKASINLNGTNGSPMHNAVFYSMTCKVSNPNQNVIMLRFNPGNLIAGGRYYVNGKESNDIMLQIPAGVNTLRVDSMMTATYQPNTIIAFENYDNTQSIVIQSCVADLSA
jgi:hypothetical protein